MHPSLSSMPSSQPSIFPSSLPSDNPSSEPSSQPSIEPSSFPSSQPSLQPSSHPSSLPSSFPSSIPSANPSVSGQPSSIPSESPSISSAPSYQPSTSPSISALPSSQPSVKPSAEPSAAPSESPSETPIAIPSFNPSVSLRPSKELQSFYPDESLGYCLNDGNEPPRMAVNGLLYSSALDCCEFHFKFDLSNCRKNSLGSALYYPKFDNEIGGCSNDGQQPLYFNRYDGYLFRSFEECCNTYYPWNVEDCLDTSDHDPCYTYMEIYDSDYLLHPERGYYPVYDEGDLYCVKDGDPPAYMLAFPEAWTHETLEKCCRANFQFALQECMGHVDEIALNRCPNAIVTLPGHTFKWYVLYHSGKDPTCVQDCVDGPDCGSYSEYHQELYDSYGECCQQHLSWVVNIRCNLQSPLSSQLQIPGESQTPAQPDHTLLQWYVVNLPSSSDPECIQNSQGLAAYHDYRYDSFDECCQVHLWWVVNGPCPLE